MAKKILVVDDDETISKLLEDYLSGQGLQVQRAQDGVQALEKAKKMSPDLIVLDVIMPNMDGYTFLREIKKDAKLRGTAVIVLSAREMMRDMFVQEGVKDFVTKPCNPEELYRVISKYL